MRWQTSAAGVAAIAVVTGAAPTAVDHDRPELYGVTWQGSLELARLDRATLRPRAGRRVRLAREPLGWSFAPDGSRLVTGSTARGARLRFIDLRRMHALGDVTVSRRGSGIATTWAGPRRVLSVVVTPACCGAGDTVVAAVDAERRRVVWRRRLGGSLQAGERLGGSLLLVLGPRGRALGPSRLIEVSEHGPTRSVTLPGIVSGTRTGTGFTESWSPGLGLYRSGRRAFVVQANAPVAELDLRTFVARSHRLPGEARAADALSGPDRKAVWLGHGMLAITGVDRRIAADGAAVERPAGLTLVDTRRWVARRLDARTTDAALVSGTLLASSFVVDSRRRRTIGSGLSGYSVSGRRKFHLFGSAPITGVQALGANALVGAMRTSILIDARSGRRLPLVPRLAMTLIHGDAPIQAR